jgi:hypothetical protein
MTVQAEVFPLGKARTKTLASTLNATVKSTATAQ